MNLNKKAAYNTTKELIIWIPRILLVVIAVSTVFYLITMPIRQNFDIDQLQQTILRQRFVYSENCLAYKEDKTYPGIVDKAKFNIKNLENCFQVNDNIGIRLNLLADKSNTISLNEKLADKFNFCFDKKHFSCSNYTYYVLIKDNSEFKSGLLNINIIKLK